MAGIIKLLIVSVIATAGWAAQAQDRKGPSTNTTLKFLMTTPLTLLDKGVFEIRRKLETANASTYWVSQKPVLIREHALNANVYIRPADITVTAYIYPQHMNDADRTQACGQLVRFAENVMGFQEGNRYMAESLQNFFSHYDYSPAGFPTDLGMKVREIFRIEGGVVANNGKTFCHSKSGGPVVAGPVMSLAP